MLVIGSAGQARSNTTWEWRRKGKGEVSCAAKGGGAGSPGARVAPSNFLTHEGCFWKSHILKRKVRVVHRADRRI